MKSSLLALLCLTLVAPIHADPASHRKTAEDMLALVSGPETLRAGFKAVLTPMLNSLRQRGASDAEVKEVETAFNDWLEKDIKWDEIKPHLVDLYVRDFTEPELKEIIAFYKSPVGAKSLKQLPAVAAESSRIGQAYAQARQAGLQDRLKKVGEKYAPKKAP